MVARYNLTQTGSIPPVEVMLWPGEIVVGPQQRWIVHHWAILADFNAMGMLVDDIQWNWPHQESHRVI